MVNCPIMSCVLWTLRCDISDCENFVFVALLLSAFIFYLLLSIEINLGIPAEHTQK